MEQKGAGLLQLLVAGGRSLGCKAGCAAGAETIWSETLVSGNFSTGQRHFGRRAWQLLLKIWYVGLAFFLLGGTPTHAQTLTHTLEHAHVFMWQNFLKTILDCSTSKYKDLNEGNFIS